uniref:Plant heme peroxidase family profile domain-containing protein n=1 Tax=Aegilops tauschii TaxID=37682 RepID=N1QYV4_AEGTA
MNPSLVARLKQMCPAEGTVADVGTPKVFDNKYFLNLLDRKGLFVSDQDLFTNAITRPMRVHGQDGPDGGQGQIRRNCAVRNPGTVNGLERSSIVQTVIDATAKSLVVLESI